MTVINVIKWHFMAFMMVINCHRIAIKYDIMGIKLTILMWVLQIDTRFSFLNDREIKTPELVIFKTFSFVLSFIKWGSLEGPFTLGIKQNYLHIWKWHDNGHQIRYLQSWSDQKWKFWTTLSWQWLFKSAYHRWL